MPPPQVPWMTRADQDLLELLDEVGIALPPKAISLALQERYGGAAPSEKTVNRRLRHALSDNGLVNQPHRGDARGYYALTELGERYLHASDAEPEEFVADLDTEEG